MSTIKWGSLTLAQLIAQNLELDWTVDWTLDLISGLEFRLSGVNGHIQLLSGKVFMMFLDATLKLEALIISTLQGYRRDWHQSFFFEAITYRSPCAFLKTR